MPAGHVSVAPGHRRPPDVGHASGLYALARAGFIEYDRVLFFSDAVFAIAITLLAVNLHVRGGGIKTSEELYKNRHALFAFGISFAAIGMFWLGHHAIFRYITALDRRLILLNLLVLGTIAFLPYPTEVLSKTSSDHWVAVVFYAACCAAAGLAEGAVWIYAAYSTAGLTDPSVSEVRLLFTLRIVRVPVVFLASIPIAIVTPQNAPYFWLLIPVFGTIVNRIFAARRRPAPPG